MLIRRRCPATGIVNFHAAPDRFVSIGSVVEVAPAQFHWRCYVGEPISSGATDDRRTAERRLLNHYRRAVRTSRQGIEPLQTRRLERNPHAHDRGTML